MSSITSFSLIQSLALVDACSLCKCTAVCSFWNNLKISHPAFWKHLWRLHLSKDFPSAALTLKTVEELKPSIQSTVVHPPPQAKESSNPPSKMSAECVNLGPFFRGKTTNSKTIEKLDRAKNDAAASREKRAAASLSRFTSQNQSPIKTNSTKIEKLELQAHTQRVITLYIDNKKNRIVPNHFTPNENQNLQKRYSMLWSQQRDIDSQLNRMRIDSHKKRTERHNGRSGASRSRKEFKESQSRENHAINELNKKYSFTVTGRCVAEDDPSEFGSNNYSDVGYNSLGEGVRTEFEPSTDPNPDCRDPRPNERRVLFSVKGNFVKANTSEKLTPHGKSIVEVTQQMHQQRRRYQRSTKYDVDEKSLMLAYDLPESVLIPVTCFAACRGERNTVLYIFVCS